MGYVIAGILVLLLVAGFVTFIVLNSMRKGSASDHSGPAGIGPDPTPLGDTSEHAGEQTTGGETAEDPERNPGEAGYDPSASPQRPEEGRRGDAGATPQPESERLTDRPR